MKNCLSVIVLFTLFFSVQSVFASLPKSFSFDFYPSIKYVYSYNEWYEYTDEEKNIESFMHTLFADYLKHDDLCKRVKGVTTVNKKTKKVIISISCTQR